MVILPLAGGETTDSVALSSFASTSVSSARTVRTTPPSSGTDALSGRATGGSLTAATATVTAAVAHSAGDPRSQTC